jgi:hypothetical protein
LVKPIAKIYSQGLYINLFHIFLNFIPFSMYFRSLHHFLKIFKRKTKSKMEWTALGWEFASRPSGSAWPSSQSCPAGPCQRQADGRACGQSPRVALAQRRDSRRRLGREGVLGAAARARGGYGGHAWQGRRQRRSPTWQGIGEAVLARWLDGVRRWRELRVVVGVRRGSLQHGEWVGGVRHRFMHGRTMRGGCSLWWGSGGDVLVNPDAAERLWSPVTRE